MTSDNLSDLRREIGRKNDELSAENSVVEELTDSVCELNYSIANKTRIINELEKKFARLGEKVEEISSEVSEIKHRQMKLNFNNEHENIKFKIYHEKMKYLIDKINIERKCHDDKIQTIDTDMNTRKSFEIKKDELESSIIQCENDIRDCRDKCKTTDMKNTISMKRNNAMILKLKNSIKEAENKKKHFIQVLENRKIKMLNNYPPH